MELRKALSIKSESERKMKDFLKGNIVQMCRNIFYDKKSCVNTSGRQSWRFIKSFVL